MADNTLQFETRVDLSGLNSGMDAVQSSVSKAGGNIQAAMTQAAQATQQLADAQIQLGAAAEAGNEQAIAIIQEYQDQLDATTRSTAQLRIEQKRQYEEYAAAAKQAALEASQAARQATAEEKSAQQELSIAQRRQYDEYIAQADLEAQSAKKSATEKEAAALEASSAAQIAQKRQYEEYILQANMEAAAAKEAAAQEAMAAKAAAQESAMAAKEAAAEQKAAAEELTIAQKRQYEEHIAQQRAIMEADKSVLSSRMAIGAEARILEGSTQGATRALAAYLSSFPGLASAAQAAFTGFALVAMAEIAVDVGKKLYDAFDMGGERARALQQDILNLNISFRNENDSLDLQIAKLDAEQAKLEHKPQNGIALTLAEAASEADHLGERLQALSERESKTIEQMSGSFLQRMVLGQSSTGYENTMLQEHVKWIERATTTQGQLNEENSFAASLQTRLNDLYDRQKNVAAVKEASGFNGTDYTQEINAVKELMSAQQAEQSVVQKTIDLNKEQGVVNNLKGEKVPNNASKEAHKELQDIEASFADLHTKLPEEAAAFWQSYIGEFKEGSAASGTEYTHVVEQINHFNDQFEKGLKDTSKITSEMKKALHEETSPLGPEIDKAMKLGNNMARANAPDLQGQQHNANMADIESRQTKSTNANALSLVPDPEGQLVALRKFHQEADEENERYYQSEIKLAEGNNELEKVKELQNKLSEIRRAANMRQLNDTKNINQQIVLAEQQSLNKIQTDIADLFSKSLSRQQTWAQASTKLYESVSSSFITNLVKMGEQSLSALAQHKSVESQKIMADAKGAAAGAYDWAAGWGGPIAGAIAAAGAFASVLAFDSFEQGGIVNGSHGMPVPIMAHAGERVLSAPQTQRFESLVNNGGSRSATLQQTNHFGGGVTQDMLQAHTQQTMSQLRSMIRPEALRS